MGEEKLDLSETNELNELTELNEVDFNQKNSISSENKKTNSKIIEVSDLRNNVLNAIADDKFDLAITCFQNFLNQPSDFPQFRNRMERLVSHCIDLVNAIRAKKNFPGMSSLTRSKQQELAEKTTDHYNELQQTMTKMDKIILQFKREDMRSTLWILRSIVYGAGVVAMIAFLKEITGGLWGVFELAAESALDSTINWVVSLFN